MNRIIYKYSIPIILGAPLCIDTGKNPVIIKTKISLGRNDIFVWIEFDADTSSTYQNIIVVQPTGQKFDNNNLTHVNTVFDDKRSLVWHIYQKHIYVDKE